MAQSNNTTTQRYSFYTLLKEYKIEIPIIQRDYAQGRRDDKTEDVRMDFLDSLHAYLSDGGSHDLDFVYGTSEKSSPKNAFIPLDGQQRLTTLFLLHWYLMHQVQYQVQDKSNHDVMNLNNVLKDSTATISKSMFSYQTRQSSTDFCDNLVGAELDMSNLIKIEKELEDGQIVNVESIAATIRDYNWFATKWDLDPTVQSMLVMLDSIHEKFHNDNHEEFLKRLLDENNPAIAFIFMDLDEYKLNDDLYILMNSRGKPLTPFENFKAKFEQYIGDIMETDPKKKKAKYKDLDISILKDIKNQVEAIKSKGNSAIDSIKKYFSFNIDTKWTYLFWAYCKKELKAAEVESKDIEKVLTDILDKKIANFIRVIMTFQYAAEGKDPKIIGNVLQNEKNAYISYNKYEKNGILSPGVVEYLISALDILSNGDKKISPIIPNSKYFNEEIVFESIINHGLTNANYADLIRFHAYLKYIIYFGKDADLLDEWMRFVYNISDLTNTRTDSPERFADAIKSISDLLNEMKISFQSDILQNPSILDYLCSKNHSFSMAHFSSWQVTEEVIKSHLFKQSSWYINWKRAILDLEDHSYFRGQIGFILEFSGIVDYFKGHGSFKNWTQELSYYDKFMRYGNIARMLFLGGYEKRHLAKNALLERAMMTFNWRFMLGYHDSLTVFPKPGRANLLCSTETSVRRDFSWRKMLHINTNDAFRHMPVKELFRHLSINNVDKSLQDIIDNANCRLSWVDAFVRYPSNMQHCTNGFIYFYDDTCFLLPRKNYSKDDAELFTFTIWKKRIESITVNVKFNISYVFANFDRECYPHIVCKLMYNNQEYAIRIQTVAEHWEFKKYLFLFECVNNHLTAIPQPLINSIQPLGFLKTGTMSDEWTLDSKAVTYDDDATVKTELQNMMTQLLTVI